ncbi:hypothetical protein [Actinoplanes sp. NPDC049118]|uniref:hypothetical protein n=1 Tax=Actinoplanes sp. NPDC049118 TaxID=3155769 RepID=UPI0033E7CDDC
MLAVLLPVLAPASIGLFVLDLLLGRDRMVIVNGDATIPGGGSEVLAWMRLGLVAAFWLLALSAAALVATGAVRGHAVRPRKAILAALRHFPVFAAGMCAAVAATLLTLWAVAGLAGAVGGGVGLVLVLGALVAAGVVCARMLVGLISHQLGGFDWTLTRGRVAGTAGAFLLGGVAVPLFLAYLGDRVLPAATLPVAARVIEAALFTGLIAVQAGILAHVYLLPRDTSGGWESTDLAAVDALLAELAGGPARRPWFGAAAMVVAVLAPAGVAAADPLGLPTVRSHADAPGGAAAVAWPAGRHPVIATFTGARFCDNDVCDRYVSHDGGPAVMDGRGSAGISADGDTVVKAALTGAQDNGGPFVHYARCTRDGCREAWLPVRASADEAFGWPELAVAVAPDDAVWFVLAMPSAENRPGKATYRVTFVRCADVACARPQRHPAGAVERMPGDGYQDGQRARLSIGADGRPVAAVRTGLGAVLVTCAPITCAAARNTWVFAGEPGEVWAAPATFTDQVSAFQPGMLRIGEQMRSLDSGEVSPDSGALAVAGSRVYATAAEATTRRQGPHITVGAPAEREQPEHWQQVLWSCDRSRCRRQVLEEFDSAGGREFLAVGADGRALIVRQDRILLVAAPASS